MHISAYKFDSNNGSIIALDGYGNIVEKTKSDYPYSYSDYVQWQAPDKTLVFAKLAEERVCQIYSDLLYKLDYKKYNTLATKHFGSEGQYWEDREPEIIENFLKEWFDDTTIQLLKVTESCNNQNGFPYWSFEWLTDDILAYNKLVRGTL